MTTYMQIDGIQGDVTAKGHENWIAINDFNFGVKRTLSTDPGRIADRESTRPSISEVTLIKKMDKSSPLLFSESCVGKAKPTVKIHCCQTDNSLNPYAEITLNNVIVSGYHVSSNQNASSHYPHENITLNFDKIELRYIPYDSQNQAQSPIPAGYDLKQAVAA
jgi:type VI secretion system secreted protein Hcp